MIARLAPAVPTPALIKAVLESTEDPSQDTVAWAVKLAGLWKGTRKPTEIRAALGVLRVAGKHSDEFCPLRSYCRDGFGKKWTNQEEGLIRLFGPKTPALDDYAALLDDGGRRHLRSLIDEGIFLPTAADLGHALSRLSACGDDARRLSLATDLAEFLEGVWDYYAPARRRGELPELSRLLRESRWVPATTDSGWARAGELVLVDNRELLELLGDAVPAPLLPDGVEAGDRWVRALRALGKKAGLAFLDAADLGREAGQAVAARLRPRLAGHKVFRQLELVGRFLDRQWFANEANGLRDAIDLGAIDASSSPGPGTVWLVCESSAQQQKIKREFPRGVVAVQHGNSSVRRALVWASGGIPVPKGPLLDSRDFAVQYIIALGSAGDEPLGPLERSHVIQAYRTLARNQTGRPWFESEARVILTEAGMLLPAETAVYAGSDPEVYAVLTKHLPGRCLAAVVRELEPAVLPSVLSGLRLDAVEQTRRDDWVRTSLVPCGAPAPWTSQRQTGPTSPRLSATESPTLHPTLTRTTFPSGSSTGSTGASNCSPPAQATSSRSRRTSISRSGRQCCSLRPLDGLR